jgi:hypothetical protein
LFLFSAFSAFGKLEEEVVFAANHLDMDRCRPAQERRPAKVTSRVPTCGWISQAKLLMVALFLSVRASKRGNP